MEHRSFTVEEANAMLPQLQEDLRELQELTKRFEENYKELERQRTAFRRLSSGPGSDDPFFELESGLDFLKIEAELLIGNFARKGVLLKMINPGLLDFPAVVGGEDVLLCWREGEDRISHYHGWHDGFAGRKPLAGG